METQKHPTQCRVKNCSLYGRHRGYCSKHHWSHKLTDAQRNTIIRRRAEGEKLKFIAADFGITEGAVTRMVQRAGR